MACYPTGKVSEYLWDKVTVCEGCITFVTPLILHVRVCPCVIWLYQYQYQTVCSLYVWKSMSLLISWSFSSLCVCEREKNIYRECVCVRERYREKGGERKSVSVHWWLHWGLCMTLTPTNTTDYPAQFFACYYFSSVRHVLSPHCRIHLLYPWFALIDRLVHPVFVFYEYLTLFYFIFKYFGLPLL